MSTIQIRTMPSEKLARSILSGVTPAAKETFKLDAWDPAVFISDLLLQNTSNEKIPKTYEQTSKSMSVAFAKGIGR